MRGKRFSAFEQPEVVAHHVHQVGGVAAVEHAERRVQAEPLRVLADQPVADRMERAGPRQRAAFRGTRGQRARASASATTRCARRVISSAARRVKVSSRMRSGADALSSRWATRCASVLVLPVPAPAITSSGAARTPPAASGSPWVAASRCAVFKLANASLVVHGGATIVRDCM